MVLSRNESSCPLLTGTAAWLIYTPAEDPFSLPLEKFQATLNVNTVSAFAAAQEAVAAFDKAPAGPRTFIYTGNILNNGPAPGFVSLGVGKTATAHLLSSADAAYKAKGYRCVIQPFVKECFADDVGFTMPTSARATASPCTRA